MKTFVELITEVKQCIDQEDNKVLANIEDSMESTTVATSNHALGSYLIYDKKVYEVTTPISVGDTLVIYPVTGYNIKVADDIMTMIETLRTKNQTLTNQVKDMNNVLGAKNILINTANTFSYNGITFTVNKDKSVTVDGTATGDATFVVSDWREADNTENRVPSGIYEFSCKNLPKNNGFQCVIDTADATGAYVKRIGYIAANQLTTINIDYSDYVQFYVFLYVTSGTTINNVTVYPMLRLASIQDDTYVPYSMTNREITPYVQAISNPNLLDNPWFTVNQRGETSVNANGKYIADRWMDKSTNDHTITRNNDGTITVTSNDSLQTWLRQTFEDSIGDGNTDYTLSILVTAYTGNVYLRLGDNHYNQITSTGLHTLTVKPNGASYAQVITAANSSVTFKALKLEKGTVSTLAMDTAPNYAEELAKCQRYFQVLPRFGRWRACGYNTDQVLASVDLPVTMRAFPSIEDNGATLHIRSLDQASDLLCTSMGVGNFSRNDYSNILLIGIYTAHGVTDGQLNIQTEDLWLSAEL